MYKRQGGTRLNAATTARVLRAKTPGAVEAAHLRLLLIAEREMPPTPVRKEPRQRPMTAPPKPGRAASAAAPTRPGTARPRLCLCPPPEDSLHKDVEAARARAAEVPLQRPRSAGAVVLCGPARESAEPVRVLSGGRGVVAVAPQPAEASSRGLKPRPRSAAAQRQHAKVAEEPFANFADRAPSAAMVHAVGGPAASLAVNLVVSTGASPHSFLDH